MDDIIQMRAIWSFALVMFGLVLPFISLVVLWVIFPSKFEKFSNRKKNLILVSFIIYVASFLFFCRELIPEKYDIKYEKVYQCEYVEKMFPVYPNGVIK